MAKPPLHGKAICDPVPGSSQFHATTARVYGSWSTVYQCPCCPRKTRQNCNFLGKKLVVCDGQRFHKELSSLTLSVSDICARRGVTTAEAIDLSATAMTMFMCDGRMMYSNEIHPRVFMIHDPARGLENGIHPFWIGNVVKHHDMWHVYSRYSAHDSVLTQEEAVRCLTWMVAMHRSAIT